jgi:hypothetical protein
VARDRPSAAGGPAPPGDPLPGANADALLPASRRPRAVRIMVLAWLGGDGACACRVPLPGRTRLRSRPIALVAQGGCCRRVVVDHGLGIEHEDCAVASQGSTRSEIQEIVQV